MKSRTGASKRFLIALTILIGIGSVLLVAVGPGYSDDTDLLRKTTAKPYVMLILDTSSSMNLRLADTDWLPLGGDDPRSRIHAAKEALYDVFKTQTRVNYGFMTFNQDALRVRSKHWLYAPEEDASLSIGYPLVPSGSGADGTDDSFTLGRGVPNTTTCQAPLNLGQADERAMVSRFPKLGEDGTATTGIWVEKQNRTYLLQVSAPNIASEPLGSASMTLRLVSRRVADCQGQNDDDDTGGNVLFDTFEEATVGFRLVGEHLMSDEGNRLADDGAEGGGNDVEDHAGFWNWHDALATAACSDGAPFTGKGLESNYDDPFFAPPLTPGDFPDALEPLLTSDDEYCGGLVCEDLKYRTSLDPAFPGFRELDRGDFIPYHWDISSHQEILRRLNPNHGTGDAPDFGAASYFTDSAAATGTGYLALRNGSRRPIIAGGETPFGKAINDYRCWYLGPNIGPSGKCRDGDSTIPFDTGWQQVAEDWDADYACRRPYAILITDGEDTCEGESPTADLSDMKNFGVKTWIINLGGREGERRLRSIVSTTDADIITLAEGSDAAALGDELRKILGIIESLSRSFAAAAVPSVQTEDEQKIFLTAFTPLNASSVWSGQALAFLKPLPLKTTTDENGVSQQVPDTSVPCDDTTSEACFLWDAGEVLKTQINAVPFGPGEDQRRVFYPRTASPGQVPLVRESFDLSGATGLGSAVERDFWRGLVVPFTEDIELSEVAARIEANRVVDFTYSLKSALVVPDDPSTKIDFLLGDNFHAEPVVVAAPTSNQLFVQDFEGYRDFALKHRFRRKMLFVATNDGMLHIIDGGIPRRVTEGGKVSVVYDRGTGREIAAYIPRAILPTIKTMADSTDRPWSVDGGLRIAGVRIDPAHAGVPSEANREWRTVLVAGLRRGGESVYALDITQPDDLTTVTVTEPIEEDVLIPDVASGASVATCWNVTGDGDDGCDEDVVFPQPLWEFDDTVLVDGETVRLDEDDNGEADFAQSWSMPNIGRIQVDDGGSIVDKFVAIFGGGFDPEKPHLRGNWLYIVDIETGKSIYKHPLVGSAASEPAAIDLNQDGLLDRVYVPTTQGFIYRLDLGPDADGNVPLMEDKTLFVEVGGVLKAVLGERRFTDRTPEVIFDNLNATTGRRLPFFFRPSVIFTPLLSPSYALAIGDGDRENLWSRVNTPGRFYVFVDDTDQVGGPITTANLERVTPDAATTSADYLFEPDVGKRNGWYLELDMEERVVANPFALSGILVFSTFQPEVQDLEDPDNRRLRLCARRGNSRAFAVLATNANGVLFDLNSNRTRSTTVNTLVSKAFADLATTYKPPSGDDSPAPVPPPLPPDMQLVMDELKKLFPSNCRFASYRIDIRAVAADTEVVDIAPVPVCVIEKNWREF